MENIENFLEYYLTHAIFKITNKLKNTKKLSLFIYKQLINKSNLQQNIICKDYTFLTNHNYNKSNNSITINKFNYYITFDILSYPLFTSIN